MKKILLIGDSIRKGYDNYVKDRFCGVADVYFPDENCMYAEHILRRLHDWTQELNINGTELDVIHWNAGLWDTLRIYEDEPLTPLDVYKGFILRIQKRIALLFPNAVSVFALSTPVLPPEKWDNPKKSVRYNSDIELYNSVAKEVLSPFGVQFDDLYTCMQKGTDFHSDFVHYYTAEGTELIGEAVTDSLLSALNLEKSCLMPKPDKRYFPNSVTGM